MSRNNPHPGSRALGVGKNAPDVEIGQTWKDRDPRSPVVVTVTAVTARDVEIRRAGRRSMVRRDRFVKAYTFVPPTAPAA